MNKSEQMDHNVKLMSKKEIELRLYLLRRLRALYLHEDFNEDLFLDDMTDLMLYDISPLDDED